MNSFVDLSTGMFFFVLLPGLNAVFCINYVTCNILFKLVFYFFYPDNLKKAVQIVRIVDYLRTREIERHIKMELDKKCIPWQLHLPLINYNKLSEIAHDCGLFYEASLMLELSIDPVL